MLKQIEGSRAVAEAVALCRPEVICAYPITPQTHIVENLGQLVKTGELTDCEFINVESEFAALSVAIGASATGARAYTATASQGLLFMAEAVYNAAGLGLPIVQALTALHGGTFRLRSKLREGTEAIVIFPANRTLTGANAAPAEADDPDAEQRESA